MSHAFDIEVHCTCCAQRRTGGGGWSVITARCGAREVRPGCRPAGFGRQRTPCGLEAVVAQVDGTEAAGDPVYLHVEHDLGPQRVDTRVYRVSTKSLNSIWGTGSLWKMCSERRKSASNPYKRYTIGKEIGLAN